MIIGVCGMCGTTCHLVHGNKIAHSCSAAVGGAALLSLLCYFGMPSGAKEQSMFNASKARVTMPRESRAKCRRGWQNNQGFHMDILPPGYTFAINTVTLASRIYLTCLLVGSTSKWLHSFRIILTAADLFDRLIDLLFLVRPSNKSIRMSFGR